MSRARLPSNAPTHVTVIGSSGKSRNASVKSWPSGDYFWCMIDGYRVAASFAYADEHITWICGTHSADSVKIMALRAAYALAAPRSFTAELAHRRLAVLAKEP